VAASHLARMFPLASLLRNVRNKKRGVQLSSNATVKHFITSQVWSIPRICRR